MELVLGWLGKIFDALLAILPHRHVVKMTEGGVKFRRGHVVMKVEPGICWWIPMFSEIDIIVTARQTHVCENQSLTTKDNKTVEVAITVVASISDTILAIGSKNWDVDSTIKDIAQAIAVEEVFSRTWDELKEGVAGGKDSKLNRRLTSNCRAQLKQFGVEVDRVFFRDLTPSKVYKVFRGGGSEGSIAEHEV